MTARIDPRDNFVICAHGHGGNYINACEREAAPDEEFCGNHGGRDFDPLDVFGVDVDDWRKYERGGL